MQSDYPLLITLGTLIVLAPILRSLLERIGVPALVGYIGLGFAVSAMDNLWSFIPPASESVFSAMAQLGIVALLFLAAVLGKFAGVAGPALLSLGRNDAILLGISMIPRAEIAPGYHVPVPAVRRRHCSCTDLFRNGARFAGDIHTLADSTAPHAWRGTLTAIPACFACYLQRMQATPGERIHLDSYIQTEPDR